MSFDSSSKYSLVDDALEYPSRCFITGNIKGPFVDTGMNIGRFDPIFVAGKFTRVFISVAALREMVEGTDILDDVKSIYEKKIKEAYQIGFESGVKSNDKLVDIFNEYTDLANIVLGDSFVGNEEKQDTINSNEPAVFVVDGKASSSNIPDDRKKSSNSK